MERLCHIHVRACASACVFVSARGGQRSGRAAEREGGRQPRRTRASPAPRRAETHRVTLVSEGQAQDFIRGSLWGSRMLQFSTVLTLLLLFSLWYLAKQEVIPFVPSCHWHNYNMNGSVFAAISQAGRKQLANRSFMPPLSVLFGTIILTEKDA
ncbi:uncharacterized protein LOC125335990 isoform X1 [Corvus hawaiiensis]|uniref:uncharacterized protein LOC125335990 isoform X1 n=1 Tax=Corvus hawaiiensis TaxID=134902 RepID=UPI002018AF24|nr:uncharacterized protein LOC125335990 isoform X1 [Corvus hawaiiensis]